MQQEDGGDTVMDSMTDTNLIGTRPQLESRSLIKQFYHNASIETTTELAASHQASIDARKSALI